MHTLRTAFACILLCALAGCASFAPHQKRLLIFSYSTGYRHASIEPAVVALRALAAREHYAAEASEDPDVFTPATLARFDGIVFVSTTSRDNDPSQEWFNGARGEALQAFVHRGGAIIGIHAAADSHQAWDWYVRLFGATFDHHPQGTPRGMLTVVDRDHPATRGLPAQIERVDEWYYFKSVDPSLHVLITLDPHSIGQDNPGPNPISWTREFEGARVFYTAMGHTPESYQEPFVMTHIAGGIRWALHDAP